MCFSHSFAATVSPPLQDERGREQPSAPEESEARGECRVHWQSSEVVHQHRTDSVACVMYLRESCPRVCHHSSEWRDPRV